MKLRNMCIAATTLAALAGGAYAQLPGEPDRPVPDRAPVHAAAKGPLEVSIVSEPTLKDHAVYRPADLTKVKGKMPIIGWGNGGCLAAGLAHVDILTKIASHGYFIVAIGPADVLPPSLVKLAPGQQRPLAVRSQAKEIIDGVDWAIAENSRKDSPYFGKLDPTKIAVSGQSCGGVQAIRASGDPRVKTSIIWNSGVGNRDPNAAPPPAQPAAPGDPPRTPPSPPQASKEDLQKYHAPVAYFIGGPSDIAYNNAEEDFKVINKVPLLNANINLGHGGGVRDPNAGWFGEVGVAWLDWQLKGDQQAAKYFVGANCTLCTNKLWTIKKKNMK